MDARRYGISLRVLTSKRSERVRYGIEQEKRNSTSTGNHVLYNSPLLTEKLSLLRNEKNRIHNMRKKVV